MIRMVKKFQVWLRRDFIKISRLICTIAVAQNLMFVTHARANVDVAAMCDAAAAYASEQTGVPVAVLRAISLTETGRKKLGDFKPWPWTVNMEGKGDWFDTREQALGYAARHHARGARSFDIGCFQLNYKWHGQNFNSIQEMFEPAANALYAAKFLRELHAEKGNWVAAAGAYHSRTPQFAQKYSARFQRIYAQISADPEPVLPVISATTTRNRTPKQREIANNFPLLLGGSSGAASLGSLMPASAGLGMQRLVGDG